MSLSSDDAEFTGENGGGSPRRRTRREISYAEGDDEDDDDDHDGESDDDDSDDDIPLEDLAEKKSLANGGKKNGKKEASPAPPKKKKPKTSNGVKNPPATKKPPPSSSTNASATKKFDYPSAALYQTECDKGLLIQRLLCRWWYAYEWPASVREEPPPNYDALDGFPGVFVCTSGDNVGHILDTRDHSTRPCFRNFALKSSVELKELLLKAIDAQQSVLENQQHAHDTDAVQRELKDMRKWANKVNAQKADKEASKVLKASGLKVES